MKNENLIRAIGALDEDLIERAEMRKTATAENETHKRRVFRRPMQLAASIAAIMIVGVSICFATGVFDSFFQHFSGSGDIDKYSEYISSTIVSATNEDLEIGIAGAVMDDHQCFIVFTAKALSDTGRDIVNKEDFPLLDVLEITATLEDSTAAQPYYTASYHKGSRNSSEAWSSYVLEVRPTDIELKSIKTLSIDFAGLSVDLDMQSYVMESVTLYSDDANALEVVEMSPIGVYAEIPVIDTDSDAMRELSASVEIIPIMADGTLAEEYFLHGTTLYNEEKKIIQVYMSFVIVEDVTLKTEITDLSIYSGLQIYGVNYYILEN